MADDSEEEQSRNSTPRERRQQMAETNMDASSSADSGEENNPFDYLTRVGGRLEIDGSDHLHERTTTATREFPLALPREHSYLEESHPLLPDAEVGVYPVGGSSYTAKNNSPSESSQQNPSSHDSLGVNSNTTITHELAVLELHGVVLFPGCTIPIKLQNPSMIRYLGKQIQRCRTDPVAQPRVLIGILPHYETRPKRHRRRRRRNPRSGRQRRVRSSEDLPSSRRRQRREPPPLPREQQQRPVQRGSWMRQRFSFGNGEISATASSHRLRQSLTRLRDEFQFVDFDREEDRSEEEEEAIHDDDDDDHSSRSSRSSEDDNDRTNLFGFQQEENSSSESDDEDDEYHRGTRSQRHSSSHPLVGRIGTIATVQHTHERTTRMGSSSNNNHDAVNQSSSNSRRSSTMSSSSLWGRYEEAPELVFTALGTSRFKIRSCISDEEGIYEVEELVEASTKSRPPFSSQRLPFRQKKRVADEETEEPTDTTITANSSSIIASRSTRLATPTERMAWNLSLVTPVPQFVYQHFTPWSLVDKIASALRTNNGKGNLPCLGDEAIVTNRSKLEPRTFSYWMANNAPFSEGERLKLLRMDSVLERLLYIWRAVEKLTASQTLSRVCCGLCGMQLASISQIFVVGGAEGTTSTYVNGHGFIHQITTLRRVIHEDCISFRDNPSTENTYFPGYSWWITCCNRCGSMLGWKFQKVGILREATNNDEEEDSEETTHHSERESTRFIDKDTPDRPPYFYGFMASNVEIVSRKTSDK